MTVARDLADFLTSTKTEDLPPQTTRNAAMIVASTLASAACGTKIRSAQIIRELSSEHLAADRTPPSGSILARNFL